MKPFTYAKTCPTRMANGDRPNGCDALEQAFCPTAARRQERAYKVHIERLIPQALPTPFSQLLRRP